MTENDKIKAELAQIKALLKKAERRANMQWIYSIGFAGMFGSLALQALKAADWMVWAAFLAGLVLMIGAPYFAKIGA